MSRMGVLSTEFNDQNPYIAHLGREIERLRNCLQGLVVASEGALQASTGDDASWCALDEATETAKEALSHG